VKAPSEKNPAQFGRIFKIFFVEDMGPQSDKSRYLTPKRENDGMLATSEFKIVK
jgi:hypothetical protein